MRKSRAPSQLGKFKVPLRQPENIAQAEVVTSATNAVRSVDNILKLISKNEGTGSSESQVSSPEQILKPAEAKNKCDSSTGSHETKPVEHSKSPGNSALRVYNVVYGKQSKKKHKTWEGDGTLEVGLKTATLKDTEGRFIGQTSCKSTELTEGSRLFVGSKEVEIIELISDVEPLQTVQVKKRNCDIDDENSPKSFSNPKKKKKKSGICPNPIKFTSREQDFIVPKNYEKIIMPKPDDEHQWTYNTEHLPLTDVTLDVSLCQKLRPHQKEGVVFLYKCVTGIRAIKHKGAILGDEMGLGKTLQCVTLIWTLLKQGPYGGKPLLKRALIVVPSSLVSNWKNEFNRWLGSHRIVTFAVDKSNKPCDYKKVSHVPVLIISYEMLVRGYEDIKDIKFDLVICDEGHRLKNANIRTATVLNEVDCSRRIILTGTPVQNDLQEFYALVNFVNPEILGSPLEFRKNYEEVIVASRDPKASEEVLTNGEKKAEELNKITSGFILRRTQSVIDSFLPQKHEYVVFCSPTNLQKTAYLAATEFWFKLYEEGLNSNGMVAHLTVITALKKICNHPTLIQKTNESEVVNEDCLSDVLTKVLSDMNALKPSVDDSSKLCIIQAMLKDLHKKKEKIVLVSNFTQTLDLLAALCDENGFKYLRFDGSTPVAKRSEIVNTFNSPHLDSFVLLLSSKAGGVGLNLIGGSRLVLFDSDWNPATDIQAMARIWREGQKKNVHIYRLLTSGTIEEKIFQRQLNKAGLSESVVDPSCISDVKLSNEELKDLFSFTGGRECLTHEMLKCDCSGQGEIPHIYKHQIDSEVDEDDERDCQLSLSNSTPKTSSLRMNQLFQWEHHAKPISLSILQEMGLDEVADKINFLFRNKTA